MQAQKDPREARAELLTVGLLVIVFALFLRRNITEPLAMLAGGLIFTFGGPGVRMFLVARMPIN